MMVGFISINGIRTSGKVAYVTTLFPYVILTILGIKAFNLPGASDGIYIYLLPQWDRLLSLRFG
ncbi:Sodium and chloridedependent glycine transporter 2like [Caligus rogercresseyi]|uniref:Sodium and chloridedependent glycine transporter 2like n=1 Tax=Caligus rogercresseyi TaxID=217165 RepID=A0A7T8KJ80_CALRO|nr:Sodium and chloridedependent glycine transporter 2like [Caligus rogercresseyi]